MSDPIPGNVSTPAVDQLLHASPACPGGSVTSALMQHEPGDLGVLRAQPGGERATHRQADDHDLLATLGEGPVALLGGGQPVAEAGGDHVGHLGAVPGQERQVHGEAGGGERLGERAAWTRGCR